jgi:hypothetical protein
MASRVENRRSFGIVGLVVALLGYVGLLLGWGGLFVGGVLLGGAIGAVDWRSSAGKVAAVLGVVGVILMLVVGIPGMGV